MLTPPFKRTAIPLATVGRQAACCDGNADAAASTSQPAAASSRLKLSQLDPQLFCSVIGTCLGTAELRKLVSRYMPVAELSELDLHHEAVTLAARGGDGAKALHKALDQRYASALASFAKAADPQALETAWNAASKQGDIPGAYWAVLTHKHCTPALRQKVFGEVHMLSHLVGAANRADIRRLVVLEQDKAELADKLEREHQRRQELVAERDGLQLRLQQQAAAFEGRLAESQAQARQASTLPLQEQALVALHTARREQAEQVAATALAEAARLRQELDHLLAHAHTLGLELNAAEDQLRSMMGTSPDGQQPALTQRLRQRTILYVGGRPSSTPALRELVQRHGGQFRHHDGGLEDRKGLLATSIPQADLVVFPVDCIDHDSAQNLKRLAGRHGIPFLALRNASLTSFVMALSAEAAPADGPVDATQLNACLRHG